MKIKPSPLVSSMSGRLNGGIMRTQGNSVIASRANQTKIAKKVYRPSATSSAAPKYASNQAIIAEAYDIWIRLKETTRQEWYALAGGKQQGYVLFMQRQVNVLSVHEGVLNHPPDDVPMTQPTGVELFIDTNGTGLEVFLTYNSPGGAPAGTRMVVYGTRNVPQSRKPLNKDYRWITQADAQGTGGDLGTAWALSEVGIPEIGWRVFVKFWFVNATTGQRSLTIEVPTIVQSF